MSSMFEKTRVTLSMPMISPSCVMLASHSGRTTNSTSPEMHAQ